MNWFQSTNAKEIGTLYLIFAVSSCVALGYLNLLVLLEHSYTLQYLQVGIKLFLFLYWVVSGCYIYTIPVNWPSIFRGYYVASYIWTLWPNFKELTRTPVLRYFYSSFFFLILSFSVLNFIGVRTWIVDYFYILPYVSNDCILQLNVELFQSYICLSFSLLSFKVSAISTNRNFSSSNYWCLEKNYLNEPLKSSTNSNLSSPESTDFLRNNYKYVDSNNSTTSKIKNADILKARYGLNREKWGFLARFHLRIKFFYRRLIIGVKKGIRIPILPPKFFNLLGQFLNRLFRFLGSVCMKMWNLLKRLELSTIKYILRKGIVHHFKRSRGLLLSMVVIIFIVKYGLGIELFWWEKILVSFFLSFCFTIIRYKVFNNNKIENKIDNNKDNNKDNNTDNNIEPNNYNKLYKCIKLFIIACIVWTFSGVPNTVYCDEPSGEINNSNNTNSTNSNTNTNTDKNNDSHNFSGSVAKGMIKEAVEGAIEGISKAIQPVIGVIAGASLGAAIIKASPSLPPTHKAALGVVTAVAGGLGITGVTVYGKSLLNSESNSKEVSSSESSGSVFNPSASKESKFDIPSILEDELSPLQMILNYEIFFCILMLVHMCILILIWLHKLFVSSGLNIISKLFSKKTATKYEKFKEKITKIGDIYLYTLIFINVIFILFYVCLIIYSNVELSNNIDLYINDHINLKKSVIMLLFIKSNFILNNNYKIYKFKSFNSWSILHKKIKINNEVFELENKQQTNKKKNKKKK